MASLLVGPTHLALWQRVIYEAEMACHNPLNPKLETYLVGLLMRYTNKPELVKQVMALNYLNSIKKPLHQRQISLQELGDNCLLFSGLFPAVARKRLIKISYFINIGQSSYNAISKHADDLYAALADQFVGLMDVLQTIRSHEACEQLLPLEAYELWTETGSKAALRSLKQQTQAKSDYLKPIR